MSVLGWLIFLLALVLSLTLHETGHFLAAKKCGISLLLMVADIVNPVA